MILHWYEHHLKRCISLLNISPTYEVQTFISYTCWQGWGGGGRTQHTHPYTHIDRVPAPMWVKNFLINVIKIWSSYLCLKQERIQEFQNQGVEFFGSGNCFDAPSHIPNVSVVRVGNNIHIVSIACWLHYSVCVLGSQNLPKQTQQIFQTGWRAPGAPVLVPPLWNKNL